MTTTDISTPLVPASGPAGRGTRLSWTVGDSIVLIGRSMRHTFRQPDSLLMGVALPVLLLLLFTYVFGGALEAGITQSDYIDYVVPGVILLTAGFSAGQTAAGITNDMTTGVIDRFRSLPINNWIVVLGHVVASMVRNLFSTALVIVVALLMGFSPTGSLLEWVGAVGIIALFILMMTFVAVMFGLLAKSVDAAFGFSFFIIFLPYVSSAFVPPETMPSALHGFAEHQPMTPIIETVRGLLMGTPIGNSGWLALLWCVGILAVVVPISGRLFRRRTTS
jgi:ABC-2 type transport system permease protein